MNFTNSPFDRMVKEVPRASRPQPSKPPIGSACRGCAYWKGTACVGTCYRDLMLAPASGQLDPKLAGARASG